MYDNSDMLFVGGVLMKERIIDPSTGTELTPSEHGEHCLGSGDFPGYECCCDECDYYLACFPDWKEWYPLEPSAPIAGKTFQKKA